MLSDLQRYKLPRLFAAFDADGNGVVELRDFERLLDRFAAFRGWKEGTPRHQELRASLSSRWSHLLKYVDVDASGTVTQAEWLAYIDAVIDDHRAYEIELDGVADLIFDVFDLDEDDALSTEELQALYRGLGLGAPTAKAMYERLEMGSDDRMTKHRFVDLLDEFLSSPDPGDPGNWLFGA